MDCAAILAIVTFAHGLSQSTASCGLPVSSVVTVSAQFPYLDEKMIAGKSPCNNTTGPLMESGSKRTGAPTGTVLLATKSNDSTREAEKRVGLASTRRMLLGSDNPLAVARG